MPAEREAQVIGVNTVAVVTHQRALHTALFDADLNPRGPSVQAVFHQFLDQRGGSFHHFASSDLICDSRIEGVYSARHEGGAQLAGMTMTCPTRMASLDSLFARRMRSVLTP